MLVFFLWLRYLRKRKIAFISITAVALCVALLLTADSLFNGFADKLETAVLWTTGDIIVSAPSVSDHSAFIEMLRSIPQAKCVNPVQWGGGLLRIGSGDVREVMVAGLEMSCQTGITDLKESLVRQGTGSEPLSFDVPGAEDAVGGWIGIGALVDPDEETDKYNIEEVREMIGKRVVLMTTGRGRIRSDDANDTAVKYRPRRKVLAFQIADVFHSGIMTRDRTVYLPYEVVYDLTFGSTSGVEPLSVHVWLVDQADAAAVKDDIQQQCEQFVSQRSEFPAEDVGRIYVRTKKEVSEGFYSDLGELRKMMSLVMLIFSVICSVAVLLIFCIFYMIVTTKRKDIAIIKSCGTPRTAVTFVFLGFGGCVGAVGSVLGILLGMLVVRNINTLQQWARTALGLKIWSSSVFLFEKIPNEISWDSVMWIVPAAIIACVVGTLIPAVSASFAEPVKILRYE
jgi:ABC-type lipoprotein release transport system permease subunit